jgi:hypothetical protein
MNKVEKKQSKFMYTKQIIWDQSVYFVYVRTNQTNIKVANVDFDFREFILEDVLTY